MRQLFFLVGLQVISKVYKFFYNVLDQKKHHSTKWSATKNSTPGTKFIHLPKIGYGEDDLK